jgi:hypothetical protein
MAADSREPSPLPLGLLCAGALLVGRQGLLVLNAADPELAPWLLSQALPERVIEALVLGVVASALAYRAPGWLPLVFNGTVLSWAAAGLPRPDVGAGWPLALALGLVLATGVSLGSRVRSPRLTGPLSAVLAGLLGIGLPLVFLARASAPEWSVEVPVEVWTADVPFPELEFTVPAGGPFELGAALVDPTGQARHEFFVDGVPRPQLDPARLRETVPGGARVRLSLAGEEPRPAGAGFEAVALTRSELRSPSTARADRPSLVLVLFDGVGQDRVGQDTTPSLAGLARQGTRFTRAVASASSRSAALASILGGEANAPPDPEPRKTLAQVLALEGFATGLFGAPSLARPSRHGAGFGEVRLDAAGPEIAVARASVWLHRVAGARFLLVVQLVTDAPTPEDLRATGGDRATAGLWAADRALGWLRAYLEEYGLDQTTVLAVVGSIELEAPARRPLSQKRLHIPLVIAGPRLPAGRAVEVAVEACAVAPTLIVQGGLLAAPGLDLLAEPADLARTLGPSGARGVRRGDWTLVLDGDDSPRLFHVGSDPEQTADVASERPDRVGVLRALLED